jgi:transcription factor 1
VGSGKLNPNVLVIGNASRLCKFGGVKEALNPFGIGILRDLSADALSHEMFNRDGPVRMLWWLPERYKHSVIPPHYIYDRSKVSTMIEMAYDVSEVAGVQSGAAIKHASRVGYTERSRPEIFDEINRQTVAERMQNAGLVLPKGRKFLKLHSSKSGRQPSTKYLSPLSNTAETSNGLRNQIKAFKARLDELSVWIRPGNVGPQNSKACAYALATRTYPQCTRHYQHDRARHLNKDRVAIITDMALRLVNIEAGFAKLKEGHVVDTSSDDLHDQIKSLKDELYDLVGSNAYMLGLVDDFVDDQLAFCSSSPLSMQDCRACEPLKAETADFYPEHDMTLLDFMPREINLSVPDLATRRECTTLTMDLLKNLFAMKTKSVPNALDTTIGVNAGRDLVKMVPEITDIRKGGRMDPNSLRVRGLTREMIEGLAKAFFEWPFRPDNWQLTLAHGSRGETEEEGKVQKKRKEDAEVAEGEEEEE